MGTDARPSARVVVERSGALLAVAGVADTPWTRMVGLLAHRELRPGDGLVLRPAGMVHTCLMRFAIDVVFADRDGVIVRLVNALRPFGLAWGGWRAVLTVELPAGTLAAADVVPGDRLRMERV